MKRILTQDPQTLKVLEAYRIWKLLTNYKSAAFAILLLLISVYLSAACVGFTPQGPAYPVKTSPLKITQVPTITVSPGSLRDPTSTPLATLGLEGSIVKGETIQFWYPRSADTENLFPSLGRDFNKSNPWEITVDMVAQEGYTDMVKGIQSSLYGVLPDLWLGYNYHAMQVDQAGSLLADLAPYVSDPEWGFTPDEVQDFLPLFWKQDTYLDAGRPGKRLGIPFYRLAQVLLYNESWARELGFLDPPSDIEKFKNQACAAARFNLRDSDPKNDGTGGWVIETDAPTLLGWISAFGGSPTGANGQDYRFDTPETERAFDFLRGLFENGCAWTGVDLYPDQEFAGRRALLITSSITALSSQDATFKSASMADRWTAIPFPPEAGKPAFDVYGPSIAIVKSTPGKQLAAWLFLKWLTSPETQARWTKVYGTIPTRLSVRDLLSGYQKTHPQWAAVIEMLPFGRTEPQIPSWDVVRWALGDAGAQLFTPTFKADQISRVLEMLDQTAGELDAQFR